ncbi:hypothetical protein [Kangiella marina]|uniref:Uncharacterized protein n=1 Tax=Kangiella marina TaxID=1079178 RepID=A0ABP8IJZ6_9GAMM
MEEQDIDIYIKAKKNKKIQFITLLLVLLVEIIWLILYLTNSTTDLVNLTAISCAVGLLIVNNKSIHGSSQKDLLGALKRQIDRDPKALQYLAEKDRARD